MSLAGSFLFLSEAGPSSISCCYFASYFIVVISLQPLGWVEEGLTAFKQFRSISMLQAPLTLVRLLAELH